MPSPIHLDSSPATVHLPIKSCDTVWPAQVCIAYIKDTWLWHTMLRVYTSHNEMCKWNLKQWWGFNLKMFVFNLLIKWLLKSLFACVYVFVQNRSDIWKSLIKSWVSVFVLFLKSSLRPSLFWLRVWWDLCFDFLN